jgi:hypothetical protein
VTSARRHPAEALSADPPAHSLSRHFPTFSFLWKCLIFVRDGLWRRRHPPRQKVGVSHPSLLHSSG